jgi:hypothetical protein
MMSMNMDVFRADEDINAPASSFPSDNLGLGRLFTPKNDEKILKDAEQLIRTVLLIGFIIVLAIEAYLVWQIWSLWSSF